MWNNPFREEQSFVGVPERALSHQECMGLISPRRTLQATITRSTTWSDGQTLTAAALNGEFDNVLNALAIVNADVSGSAAIASTKIAFGGTSGQYLTSNGSGGLTYSGLTINRAFGFFAGGSQSVANDVSWDPISPQAMTAVKIWAYCKTAPTGADLIARVFNITDNQAVASVTISAGATSGNSTSMTNAALTAGDVLRLDFTQVGSSVPGADVSVILECTSP